MLVSKLTNLKALERAIAIAGGPEALAKSIGVTATLPYMWRARKRVPAEHCPAIEGVTNGLVRCEDLRPDVPWRVLREAA